MKKIRLDVEALEVDSFDTGKEGEAPRGTVRGHLTVGSTMPYVPSGASCFGDCLTREYDTCFDDAPTDPASCNDYCGW